MLFMLCRVLSLSAPRDTNCLLPQTARYKNDDGGDNV